MAEENSCDVKDSLRVATQLALELAPCFTVYTIDVLYVHCMCVL